MDIIAYTAHACKKPLPILAGGQCKEIHVGRPCFLKYTGTVFQCCAGRINVIDKADISCYKQPFRTYKCFLQIAESSETSQILLRRCLPDSNKPGSMQRNSRKNRKPFCRQLCLIISSDFFLLFMNRNRNQSGDFPLRQLPGVSSVQLLRIKIRIFSAVCIFKLVQGPTHEPVMQPQTASLTKSRPSFLTFSAQFVPRISRYSAADPAHTLSRFRQKPPAFWMHKNISGQYLPTDRAAPRKKDINQPVPESSDPGSYIVSVHACFESYCRWSPRFPAK